MNYYFWVLTHNDKLKMIECAIKKYYETVWKFCSTVLSECGKCHFWDPKFKTFFRETMPPDPALKMRTHNICPGCSNVIYGHMVTLIVRVDFQCCVFYTYGVLRIPKLVHWRASLENRIKMLVESTLYRVGSFLWKAKFGTRLCNVRYNCNSKLVYIIGFKTRTHIYYTISSNYNRCGGGRSTVPELVILSYLSIMQPRTQGISTILDRFLDEKPRVWGCQSCWLSTFAGPMCAVLTMTCRRVLS